MPITLAPNCFSQAVSHEPLNPVCPVTITLEFLYMPRFFHLIMNIYLIIKLIITIILNSNLCLERNLNYFLTLILLCITQYPYLPHAEGLIYNFLL